MSEERAKEFDDNANISITGRNIQATFPMEEHIHSKLEKIREMCPAATNIKVILEVNKDRHKAEIIFAFSHFHLMVHSTTLDLYQSIDQCCLKLKAKLRKWKQKSKVIIIKE